MMALPIRTLIAHCVNQVIRQYYPRQYSSLCHVYAIIGSNLISIVLDRVYRPVAGLAAIDCGGGQLMTMLDNGAFAHAAGGSYHCWIESADDLATECEVVDLTFRHNHTYAEQNGFGWQRALPPDFLWGKQSDIVVQAPLHAIPRSFPEGMVWLQETDEGWHWMMRQLQEHQSAFVTLTAEALKLFQAHLAPDSALLARPAATETPATLLMAAV
ncbi:hypothetical protein [Duganella qianjiadongensis]|uniref:SAM-dependent methyltransferase n=1 Tax=Duganella qianjiadongensis TaxID=2692176 RepID=A0ABW9VGU8_9BURK|nr:hypothetical protein [Duganella qianjiadongensis]MYM38849.1 hypothetical protein [Duganella qianjiadongensis]